MVGASATSECVTAARSAVEAEYEAFVDILRSLNHTNHHAAETDTNADGDGEHTHNEDRNADVNISTDAHLTDPTDLTYINTNTHTNMHPISDTSDIDLFLSAYDTTLSPVVAQRVVAAIKDRTALLDTVGFAPENVRPCMCACLYYV